MDVRRVFSGLNVIAVGLILLANTLGYLPWGVWWNILSLWPLLLVAAGLDILGEAFDVRWMRAVSGAVVLGGLAFGALVMPATGASTVPGLWTIGAGQSVPYEQSMRRQGTSTEASLKLSEGASDIVIGPAAEGVLVSVKGRSSRPVPQLAVASAGRVAAATISRPTDAGPVLGGSTMDVGLSRELPWRRLVLETGASSVAAALAELRVSSLGVDAGASSVAATLGALADCAVDVSAGASSVTLNVPSDARVTVDSDSALVDSDLPGFQRTSGNGLGHTQWVYEPKDRSATATLSVKVSMGAGSLGVHVYPTLGSATPRAGSSIDSTTGTSIVF